jgi:DNA transposition AAA+ family ATPase
MPMNTLAQLKQIHDQMTAELARVPQYRALKAMERFMAELSQFYEGQSEASEKGRDFQDKISLAIENRLKAERALSESKVTPYIPDQRVA